MRFSRALPSRVAAGLCCLLGALVFVDTSYLIVRYHQPLFVGDIWDTVEGYQKFLAGRYRLTDLFAQHNEHRLILPRLIFLADYSLGHGLEVIDKCASYAIQLCDAALLVWIASSILRGASLAAATGIVFVLLFNYGQLENFEWGFQVQFVGVYAAASFACWWFARSLTPDGGVRLGYLFASFAMVLVAAGCMSNGPVVAFVLAYLAILARASLATIIGSLVFAVALASLYFYGFHAVAQHSTASFVLQHPFLTLQYILVYLGGPLKDFGILWASVLGGVGIVLAGAAMALVMVRRERSERLALIGVMSFVLASGAATAFGRASLGVSQAMASRYLTPVCIFWAALFIFWCSFRVRTMPRLTAAVLPIVTVFVLTGAVQLHLAAREGAPWTYYHRGLQTDALLSGVQRPDLILDLYPWLPGRVEQLSAFLADRRLNIFARPGAAFVGKRLETIGARRDDSACVGENGTAPSGQSPAGMLVAGWAWDDLAKSPVEHIVIADDDSIVGFAEGRWFWFIGKRRPDHQVIRDDLGWVGLAKTPRPYNLPSAFALLDDGRVICKLPSAMPTARMDGSTADPEWLDPSKVGEPIAANHAVAGGWTTNGFPPHAPPPGGGAAFGSWSDGMGRNGAAAIGPFSVPSRRFAVSYMTGSNVAGASIEIDDAETLQVYAVVKPKVAPSWETMAFDVPDAVADRPLVLKGVSNSDGVETWLALGEPHMVRR